MDWIFVRRDIKEDGAKNEGRGDIIETADNFDLVRHYFEVFTDPDFALVLGEEKWSMLSIMQSRKSEKVHGYDFPSIIRDYGALLDESLDDDTFAIVTKETNECMIMSPTTGGELRYKGASLTVFTFDQFMVNYQDKILKSMSPKDVVNVLEVHKKVKRMTEEMEEVERYSEFWGK